MNDKELERLLQDEWEGIATPEESARLREHLARSERARARRDELRALCEALGQVPSEDAPVELKEGVMAAIAAGHETAAVRTGPLDTLRAALRGARNPAWASPFLAGAVAGGLVIALVAGLLGPRARTDLPVTGTMPPGLEEGTPLDRLELRVGDSRVLLVARRVAGTVRVRFLPELRQPTELELEYDGEALRPAGLLWEHAGAHRASLGAGRVTLELSERGQGTLLFKASAAGSAPLQVTIRSGAGTAQGILRTAVVDRRR